MLTRNEPSEIDLIHREYQRINEKWLRVHAHLTLSIALFVGALEIALYFALRYMDIVSSSRNIYFIKYFLIPTSLNLGLSLFCHLVQRSRRIPLRGKAYAVSLSLAGIGLILYSVHSVFSSLVLAVAMPIVLTTVYSDRLLTTVTALSSIAGKVLSDLLLQWDLDVVKDFSDREQLADLVLSVVVLFAIYTLCDVLIRVEQEKNNVSIRRELERQHLREQAITDPLSGTWNRQGLEQAIAELDANPTGSYALAILDLDEFKSINDTYGHLRGDKYIQELGKVLNDCGEGIPFRFGGDEFCILFCNHSQEDVLAACRSIQRAFVRSPSNRTYHRVTLSIGVAFRTPGINGDQLLQQADSALYRAKADKGSIFFYHPS